MPVRVCHWNHLCQLTLFRRTYELDDGQVRSLIFFGNMTLNCRQIANLGSSSRAMHLRQS